MQIEDVHDIVRQTISRVANVDLTGMDDSASYKEDLGLDSLTILEIAIETDIRFGTSVPEEELATIHTIDDTVRVVAEHLGIGVGVCASESL